MTCPYCKRELDEHGVDNACLNAWVSRLRGWRVKRMKSGRYYVGRPPDPLPTAYCHLGQFPERNTYLPHYATSIADAFALQASLPEQAQRAYIEALCPGADPKYMSTEERWRITHASALQRTKAYIAAMAGATP